MSKLYKVDMSMDVSKFTMEGGFLMKPVPKEEDVRGAKERTGPEIFAFLVDAGIGGSNPKVNFEQGKILRKIAREVNHAAEKGEFLTNKSNLDTIKGCIRGNRNWPNTDEIFLALDVVMESLENAKLIDENPSGGDQK